MSTTIIRPNVQKALKELRDNSNFQPIVTPPLRPIKSVQFGILGPDEIKGMSVCHVTQSRVAQPPLNTVYDERMGPSHSRGQCLTCLQDIRICPGHFGHVELAQEIINPLFTKYLIPILNCICLECSQLRTSREVIELESSILENERYIRYVDKLNVIVQKCGKEAYCNNCNFPHPKIKEINGQIFKVYDETKCLIEPGKLKEILSKIDNSDLEIMGFQPKKRTIYKYGTIAEEIWSFRPENMILSVIPVLPPMARPPANEGDNRSDDDLTTTYTEIIKYNERLKKSLQEDGEIGEKNREDYLAGLMRQFKGLVDNTDKKVIRNSGKASKGIKERISGKQGHVRGRSMGKRVDCSARSVIVADITLELDQLGVPEEIAKSQSFPEKVTRRNIESVMKSLEKGKINTIICGKTKKTIRVHLAKQEIIPKYGDIIYRQLEDNDVVVFNRQPTLHRGSMMAHRVKILPGKTFRLNLSVTTPYNADENQRLQQEA